MSMVRKLVLVVSLSFFLVSCAAPITHNTPSNRPEVAIDSTDAGKVKSFLVSAMLNHGYNITRESDFRIVFDRPVQNALAAALLGSRYDSTPNARVTFSVVPSGNTIRVIADLAVITNPGSAFERRMSMNSHQNSKGIQALMDAVKIQTEE